MTKQMSQIIHFSIFYQEVKATKIPVKTAYRLNKLTNAINEHVAFYQEQIRNLLQEHAEKDVEGEYIYTNDNIGVKIKEESQQEFVTKVNELLALDVELPDITFSIEEFGDIELSMEVFNIIIPFLTEE
jgi:hypothetical protein